MKIVIHTQDMENYGAHTWNGEGECPQYWKFKGGDTYVLAFEDVTSRSYRLPAMVDKLRGLIECRGEGFETYISSVQLVPLGEDIGLNEWERPIEVRRMGARFYASRERLDWQDRPCGKESWKMAPDGERENFRFVEDEDYAA